MRTTLRGLRRLINEARVEKEPSVLGIKNKEVSLNASSKLGKRIAPDLFDIVTSTYQKVGGNPKIKTPEDIGYEYPDWVVADVDDDPEVDVFVGGRHSAGKMKLSISATDGTQLAKNSMYALKKKLYDNGWWSEASDAPAHIAMNKLGIKPVEDEKKVRALLNKDIEWHGDHPEGKFPGTHGWYTRDIGGEKHTKIVIGDV